MTNAQTEQREAVFALSCGVCEVCGKPLADGYPQGAHKIANTKANRAKWGSAIIDNPLNMSAVCGLRCNDKCNIGNNLGKCWELVRLIAEKETGKYEQ